MKDLWKYRWYFYAFFWIGLAQFMLCTVETFATSFGLFGLSGGFMFFVPYTHNGDKIFGTISIFTIIVSLIWIYLGFVGHSGMGIPSILSIL